MAKAKTKSFILELKLDITIKSEHILNKRFEIGRVLYNTLVKFAGIQLHRIWQNKMYKKYLTLYLSVKKLIRWK